MTGDVAAQFRSSSASMEEIEADDRTHGALTAAVRALNEAQLQTAVDHAELDEITAQVSRLTERLAARRRGTTFGVEIALDGSIRNHSNAVVGLRNPFAPVIGPAKPRRSERRVAARLVLGELYEGPPGHVHGGVSALLLDQVVSEAAAAAGAPAGMTARLTLTYDHPTPLGEIEVEGWLDRIAGPKVYAAGVVRHEGRVTVRAEGLLIVARWARDGWPVTDPGNCDR